MQVLYNKFVNTKEGKRAEITKGCLSMVRPR